MANEKAKIEQSALKYFQRGQLVKAIGEYQRIVAMDPSDIRIRVKLLDLYARAGLKTDVVEECKRISATLADQGFILRAIAVWKQALKVVPNDPLVYCSMGELYVKQGLLGDAIASFKKGVDIHIANKAFMQASDLLRKMEVLAPDNVAIKSHLAELFLEQGDEESFSMQLTRIIEQLKVEGRQKKLASILEGLFSRKGRRLEVIVPLVELYLESGEEQKAHEAIRAGLAIAPHDNYLRTSLVRVNLALGNIIDARKVALSIHEEEPDNAYVLEQLLLIAHARGDEQEMVQWYKELAKASAELGDSEREDYYYLKVLELAPDDAEARLAMGDFGPAAPVSDKGGDALAGEFYLDFEGEASLGSSPPASQVTAVEEGIIEADLYLKYGLLDKALATLTALVERVPGNIPVRVRLRDLHGRMGNASGKLDQQLTIARLLLESGREAEALRAFGSVLELDPANQEALSRVSALRGTATAKGAESVNAALDEELLSVDRLIDKGETGDAVTVLLRLQERYPSSTEVSARLADLGWVTAFEEPLPEEERDEFEELRTELGEIDFDISSIAGFEQGEVSELDDILREFKSGMAENLDEEDYDTHYDLGIAYREMGLLEDALQEFQKAAHSVDKAKAAYTSMAMVYRETGNHAEARAALRKALDVPTNTGADRAAILFELGSLAEEVEDWREALNSFEDVAALDPTHRDVVKRLAHVRSRV